MITLLVAADHRYTHRAVKAERDGPALALVCYHNFFVKRAVPAGTYIFADFDRLNFWDLEVAGEAFAVLKAAGCRVLNDPAQARQRYAMLRRLKHAGINRFGVYRIESGEMPECYPVFLRNESGHSGPLTELLPDEASLHAAIDEALARGIPERHLLAVEYAAEPISGDIYRKMGAFRVGDRIIQTQSVHQRSWKAKAGELGVAGEALYRQENEMLRANPYADMLMRAFTIANIEYGRADFAVVGGGVQIYEINTNPFVSPAGMPHPFEIRRDSVTYARREYLAALHAIDTPTGKPVRLDKPKLAYRRSRLRWPLFYNRILSTP